jgi:hypothetical protein
MSYVERKILFYEIHTGNDPSTKLPYPFNVLPALQHIETLPFTDAGRYSRWFDGAVSAAWLDRLSPAPIRIRLGHVRRQGLPMAENAGQLSKIPLAPKGGLAEATHIVFFPDRIIGADFNFHGPRISRLPTYLHDKAPGLLPAFSVLPLLRADVVARLRGLRDITMLRLKIKTAAVGRVPTKSLRTAFSRVSDLAASQNIEVILRASREGSLGRRFRNAIRSLAGNADFSGSAQTFKVKGRKGDGDSDAVDVLKDHLVSTQRILVASQDTRALDPNSAYAAIEDAYAQMKADLAAAAPVFDGDGNGDGDAEAEGDGDDEDDG